MRIWDCFLYNGEWELLLLRIQYLKDIIHKFVIVESALTFTGNLKSNCLNLNADPINKYRDKIKYYRLDKFPPGLDPWGREFFLRDYIRKVANGCEKEDVLIISDVDEILNRNKIISFIETGRTIFVECVVHQSFFNMQSTEKKFCHLIAPYREIKTTPIGNRTSYFEKYRLLYLNKNESRPNGWHFTYLFGSDIGRYIAKLNSFSHQEFNSSYYMNRLRLQRCIKYGFDVLDRDMYSLKFVSKRAFDDDLWGIIESNDFLNKYLRKRIEFTLSDVLGDYRFLFVKFKKRIKSKLLRCIIL